MPRRPRRGVIDRATAPIRLNWYRAVRSAEGSRHLAGGLGLGVFLACFPIFVLHFPVAWLMARMFRLSRMAAVAGVLVANPFTVVPLYTGITFVGVFVTPDAPSSPIREPQGLLRALHEAALRFDFTSLKGELSRLTMNDLSTVLMGATVVGVLAGAVTYVLSLRWIEHRTYRRRVVWARARETTDE